MNVLVQVALASASTICNTSQHFTLTHEPQGSTYITQTLLRLNNTNTPLRSTTIDSKQVSVQQTQITAASIADLERELAVRDQVDRLEFFAAGGTRDGGVEVAIGEYELRVAGVAWTLVDEVVGCAVEWLEEAEGENAWECGRVAGLVQGGGSDEVEG